MVHAVGDDEDFIAFLVGKQGSVRLADDAAHVELVEGDGFETLQTTVFNVEYGPCDERGNISPAFHTVGEDVLVVDGFRDIFLANVLSGSQ